MKWNVDWQTSYYNLEPGVNTGQAHIERLMKEAKQN